MCSYPAGYNRVYFFGVPVAESHEVSVECSNSLQAEADVSSRGEFQQGWGEVICTRSAIDQGCVDLKHIRKNINGFLFIRLQL